MKTWVCLAGLLILAGCSEPAKETPLSPTAASAPSAADQALAKADAERAAVEQRQRALDAQAERIRVAQIAGEAKAADERQMMTEAAQLAAQAEADRKAQADRAHAAEYRKRHAADVSWWFDHGQEVRRLQFAAATLESSVPGSRGRDLEALRQAANAAAPAVASCPQAGYVCSKLGTNASRAAGLTASDPGAEKQFLTTVREISASMKGIVGYWDVAGRSHDYGTTSH